VPIAFVITRERDEPGVAPGILVLHRGRKAGRGGGGVCVSGEHHQAGSSVGLDPLMLEESGSTSVKAHF